MKKLSTLAAKNLIAICLAYSGNSCIANTYALNSPSDINDPITITFDSYASGTVATNLYQNQGITFSRDDGQPVFIYSWQPLFGTTVSEPNVLATVTLPGASTYATQLNVQSSNPMYAMGAYFGNDQNNPDYAFTQLSVYGLSGQLLGSVEVAVNNNSSVDQFIGIQSDIPFTEATFQNLNSSGDPSTLYAVAIDNLSYSLVPEPMASSFLVLMLTSFIFLKAKKLTTRKPTNLTPRWKSTVIAF
jgi:hypothetical protein